jgi:hypothetical protein
MVRVIEARYVKDYVVWLRFDDGTEGTIDLGQELHGEVFEPLRNKKLFRSVAVHPEWHTIVWSNGADFAPEFLYDAVKVRQGKRSGSSRSRNSLRGHARAGANRGTPSGKV